MKKERRVVITGLGMITPLGCTVEENWENILNGKSGISKITSYDVPGTEPEDFKTEIAGLVKNFNPLKYFKKKDLKKNDICLQYGIAAGIDAFKDSGLEVTESNAERIGVFMSSGFGGITLLEDARHSLDVPNSKKKLSPFCIPSVLINLIPGNLSISLGLKGPNLSAVSACTTGTHSIGLAARAIAYGDADVMIAGGSEKASTAVGIGGFSSMKALSTRNDEPEKASRPWDKDRDGFVLSDGSGALILEEYEHAKKRGAKIYAELAGFGMNADAYHVTAPSGSGALRCMQLALEDANLSPNSVNYVNAHGTSTPVGDPQESLAVEKCLKEQAKNIVISSTKSMTGHLLGATGAVEAIYTILAIRDQIAPPTINLDNVSENCNLDYAPHKAKKLKINVAMSNSFGFGGTNGTLVFKKI